MGYVNALKVLPKELVEQIQKYVEGQVIYIPKPKNKWRKWGENTDTKEYIEQRNTELYLAYKDGATIQELSKRYFLDPKSVQRIIRTIKD